MGFFSRFRKNRSAVPPQAAPAADQPSRPDPALANMTLGWDAIDSVFDAAYPGQEPQHWGTLIRWSLGGPDPLDGVSAYRATQPVPHWHYVTFGYSDLYGRDAVGREPA
ncbi:suppressor of fused domain protein, partial [Brooklawnia sp.]|uniref:suppressor of fused domain protein n=1 Tax=Brooklawnia sp. TaxID=2699740 RepID=UPI00312050AB